MATRVDARRARPLRLASAAAARSEATSTDKHCIEFLVSEFIARYLREPRHGRKRPAYAEGILECDVLPASKRRDARTIAPEDVLSLLDEIVDRGAPVMANRTAAVLAQLFKFGIHRRIVESTPEQPLYHPGGREKPRERALSEAELKTFLIRADEVRRRDGSHRACTARAAADRPATR